MKVMIKKLTKELEVEKLSLYALSADVNHPFFVDL